MATIGLDRLYYSNITEDENGIETYGTPKQLAKAIKADLSIELAEAVLYADDGAAEVVKEFKSGKLSLGIDDIGVVAAEDLTGAKLDDNKVLISTSEDGGSPVAIGFRAKKANGKYRYFWLFRVKFGIPETNLQTKGDSITFQTPTIEGTVMRRNKLDGQGKHPWKAEVNEGETGVTDATISGWFNKVYEPAFGVIIPTITIITQPVALIEAEESSIDAEIKVVASSNTSGSLIYQWYENTENSNIDGSILEGEIEDTLIIPTDLTVGTYYYYCVVGLVGAESVKTNVSKIVVSDD